MIGPFMRMVIVSDAQEIEDIFLRRGKSLDVSSLVVSAAGGLIDDS
jgi:hypothetical protein